MSRNRRNVDAQQCRRARFPRQGQSARKSYCQAVAKRRFRRRKSSSSGAAGGSYSGDISVPILGTDRVVERKSRAGGFKQIYNWLDDRDVLVVKADRRGALAIVLLWLAIEIVAAAEAKKS